jgi:hypothetical protein
MFKKLIKSLVRSQEAFDPSAIDDPIAQKVDWIPAKGGGTNIRTHRLVEVNPNRLAFRPTVGVLIFGGIFLLAGLGAGIGIGTAFFRGKLDAPVALGIVFMVIFPAVFGGAGFWILRSACKPRFFDAREEWYWCSRKPIEFASHNDEEYEHGVPFADIHALQIISEYCRSDKSSYYSYELNIVLKEGDRVNVIDHGNIKKLRLDAETLAEFLDVPLWDAS